MFTSVNPFRFLSLVIIAVFAALLVMPQLGRGDDATQALDEYERYIPGNRLPDGLPCGLNTSYFEEYRTRCQVEGGTYCAYGRVSADRGVIEHAVFYECSFPVAYLMAEYGHYRIAQHYRRSTILRWSHVYAHVENIGWLDAMQTVETVAWWRPLPIETNGL
jgi:hypothetical protein